MNNDEIERGSSTATAACAIINAFVITHSIIITVLVAVSVLAVALSPGKRACRRLETVKDLEAWLSRRRLPGRLLDGRANRRRDVIRSIGGGGAVEPGEAAGQAVPAPGPDPRADLEAFLNENYRYLLMAPMAVGASVDDAHEAVQAAVADMLEKDTWSRLTSNPKAWVRKAARHAYYDQQAKRRRNRQIESLSVPSAGRLDDSLNVWEDWQWVSQMLTMLPPAQREVFELVLAELDAKEVADLLGKTPATIRQNLAHARRRLKASLGADYQVDLAKKREEDTP